eukprot:TRINITY_DN1376_c0_g1_i10.p3 TRINITY_DN1376_c0_g1~~TRINITY_DN1376_c0_g1_i10.p3  ORF type:complete len:140 (-),score=16.24 TRINITY_DN1376_c0_g1_i10:1287-1706(-)
MYIWCVGCNVAPIVAPIISSDDPIATSNRLYAQPGISIHFMMFYLSSGVAFGRLDRVPDGIKERFPPWPTRTDMSSGRYQRAISSLFGLLRTRVRDVVYVLPSLLPSSYPIAISRDLTISHANQASGYILYGPIMLMVV